MSEYCAWDKTRPCDKTCAAYNKTELDGTRCGRLYATLAKTRAINSIGNASTAFIGIVQNLTGLLAMGGFGKK